MQSAAVNDRIAEDIAQARQLGLKATPGIFLGNKKVRSYMLYNKQFMKQIKKYFMQMRSRKLRSQGGGPSAGQGGTGEATPGIPNP